MRTDYDCMFIVYNYYAMAMTGDMVAAIHTLLNQTTKEFFVTLYYFIFYILCYIKRAIYTKRGLPFHQRQLSSNHTLHGMKYNFEKSTVIGLKK